MSGFADTRYYAAAANSMPGHVDGFFIAQLVRIIGRMPDQGVGFGCYNLFQNQGGYHLSLAPDGADPRAVRAVFGIGQQSDGDVIENALLGQLDARPSAGLGPWWRQYGRLYLQAMSYDGNNALCYLNGELVTTLGPTGGYQVPNAALTPFLGRNTNAVLPQGLEGVELLGAGYGVLAGGQLEADVIDHWLATLEAGTFVDEPSNGFDDWWTFDGEATTPAVLADQAGAVPFAKTESAGALALAERNSYF